MFQKRVGRAMTEKAKRIAANKRGLLEKVVRFWEKREEKRKTKNETTQQDMKNKRDMVS